MTTEFALKFNSTNDCIPFEVIQNHQLFEYFVAKTNVDNENQFFNNYLLANKVNTLVPELKLNLDTINELMVILGINSLECASFPEGFLNQDYLNRLHADWVFSQENKVDINELRVSKNKSTATIGNQLHEMYPDEIRVIRLAELFAKLGVVDKYERINMGIHELESSFDNKTAIFDAPGKYNIFDNPFKDSIITNNSITNFNFGYTYLGRQRYDKFINFDNDLKYQDHYNFEQLEFSFNINLSKPQTVPFNIEFLEWCNKHNITPIGQQIPIGNILDLDKNLTLYREILYRNSKENNKASIVLH